MLFNTVYGDEFKSTYYLINKNEVVPKSELSGEEKVLNSPIIEKAFQRILEDFVPKHDKVIFSLCTINRPYLKSVKWDMYNKIFGNDCDLIVCSNGGIIPMQYMCCYPFLTYNAPHQGTKHDELYMEVMERRLKLFLEKNSKYYNKMCFTFIPDTRNYKSIQRMNISNSKLIPDKETYENALKNDIFIGFNKSRYPLCNYTILNQMMDYLTVNSSYVDELVEKYKNKTNPHLNIFDSVKQVFNILETNKGYELNELVKRCSNICDCHLDTSIVSTIKWSTINIDISGHYKSLDRMLFYYENGLFYKLTNPEEYKNYKPREIKKNKLF